MLTRNGTTNTLEDDTTWNVRPLLDDEEQGATSPDDNTGDTTSKDDDEQRFVQWGIDRCFLVHLIILLFQFQMAICRHPTQFFMYSPCPKWSTSMGVVIFGLVGFLYRDAVYHHQNANNRAWNPVALFLPELMVTLVLACIVTGYGHVALLLLFFSVVVLCLFTFCLALRDVCARQGPGKYQ